MTSLTSQDLAQRPENNGSSSFFGRLRDHMERRKAYRSLVALDDRLLTDMGLERATLKAAVFGRDEARRPSVFTQLWQGFQRARQRRATISALHALPDNLLADIGIERGLVTEFTLAKMGDGSWPYEPHLQAPSLGRGGLIGLAEAAVRPFMQWNLSRRAAGQMARIDGKLLDDIGYVKGDVDWVPEVLASRRLDAANRNERKIDAA